MITTSQHTGKFEVYSTSSGRSVSSPQTWSAAHAAKNGLNDAHGSCCYGVRPVYVSMELRDEVKARRHRGSDLRFKLLVYIPGVGVQYQGDDNART
jgi:hypothetical protein